MNLNLALFGLFLFLVIAIAIYLGVAYYSKRKSPPTPTPGVAPGVAQDILPGIVTPGFTFPPRNQAVYQVVYRNQAVYTIPPLPPFPTAINSNMNIYGIVLSNYDSNYRFSRYINTVYFLTKYSSNIERYDIAFYYVDMCISSVISNYLNILASFINELPTSFLSLFKDLNNYIVKLIDEYSPSYIWDNWDAHNAHTERCRNYLNDIYLRMNNYISNTPPPSTITTNQIQFPTNVYKYYNEKYRDDDRKYRDVIDVYDDILCIFFLIRYLTKDPNKYAAESNKNINYICQIIFNISSSTYVSLNDRIYKNMNYYETNEKMIEVGIMGTINTINIYISHFSDIYPSLIDNYKRQDYTKIGIDLTRLIDM